MEKEIKMKRGETKVREWQVKKEEENETWRRGREITGGKDKQNRKGRERRQVSRQVGGGWVGEREER